MIVTRTTPSRRQIGRLVFVLALGLLVVVKAKAGEGGASAVQDLACTPDGWRLCSVAIPDVGAVKACMIANKANLSSMCRASFR